MSLPKNSADRAKIELDLSTFQLGGVYEVDPTAAAYLVACQIATYEMRSLTSPSPARVQTERRRT